MTLRPKHPIASWVLVLGSLVFSASALAQDDEFVGDLGAAPPPPMDGGDFEGESFGEPPVAPLTPDSAEAPPMFEPPPPVAPPAQKQGLGNPNPGAAFSGATENASPAPQAQAPESLPADGAAEDEETSEEFVDEEDVDYSQAPPAEAPEAPPTPSRGSGRAKIDVEELLLPPYQRKKPQWAIGLAFSPKALGTDSPTADASGSVYGFAAQFEYQPRVLQKYGVLGIGPTLSYTTGQAPNAFRIYGVGGQVRYQARFFREQPIVPVAAYTFGLAQYRFDGGDNGTVTVSGPAFGAWFLLNIADPTSAASFYADFGISRSYLVAELQMPSGSDGSLEFGGNTYYFGLRVEF